MNREIKFRAWDKANKAMREIWSITWDFTPEIPKMILACNPVINTQYALREGEFEILQYTGLKDKNGKEIYEGDIIKITNHRTGRETNGIVKFDADVCESGFHFGSTGWYKDEFEIIGNIYENPELCNQ